VDLGRSLGLDNAMAYQVAFGAFGICSLVSWLFFRLFRADNRDLT